MKRIGGTFAQEANLDGRKEEVVNSDAKTITGASNGINRNRSAECRLTSSRKVDCEMKAEKQTIHTQFFACNGLNDRAFKSLETNGLLFEP